MFIVEWIDRSGNLQQWAFDTQEDAEREAASLEEEFEYVAIIAEIKF